MNVIREIQRINETEMNRDPQLSGSWHDQYSHSPYIYVGGLPFELTEGDILTIFSQYGPIVDINLIRDKDTGKSKGFAFIAYEIQKSTVLAVDNFNGIKILSRTLRVDHCQNYRKPKPIEGEHNEDEEREELKKVLAPPEEDDARGSNNHSKEEEDDPMFEYFRKKEEKRKRKEEKKKSKDSKKKKI